MRIVEKPSSPPHRCAVNPGCTSDRDGFVDTGTVLNAVEPAIYVAASSVRAMALLYGFATPEEKQELEGRVRELERDNEALNQELNQANYDLQAVERLERKGFERKKRAGRPPNGVKAKEAA